MGKKEFIFRAFIFPELSGKFGNCLSKLWVQRILVSLGAPEGLPIQCMGPHENAPSLRLPSKLSQYTQPSLQRLEYPSIGTEWSSLWGSKQGSKGKPNILKADCC